MKEELIDLLDTLTEIEIEYLYEFVTQLFKTSH